MSSIYLSRLKRGLFPGLKVTAVETAEYAAASYAFGYAQNRWRDKATIKGIPLDLLAGVGLKVAAIAVDGKLAPHLDRVGTAGIGAFFHTMGAGHGAQAAGVRRLLINASDVDKAKKALPNATILGAIPKAPHGDFLSSADLMSLAR